MTAYGLFHFWFSALLFFRTSRFIDHTLMSLQSNIRIQSGATSKEKLQTKGSAERKGARPEACRQQLDVLHHNSSLGAIPIWRRNSLNHREAITDQQNLPVATVTQGDQRLADRHALGHFWRGAECYIILEK